MNAARRSEIQNIAAALNEQLSALQQVAADEQEYFDNMPESLQQGEKGQKAEEAAQALQEAADELENQISNIEAAAE